MVLGILIALIVAPAVLFTLLRINGTLVFLSVCLGDVLAQFVSNDASMALSSFSPKSPLFSQNNVKIVLLLLPVVLTALIMIKTVKGSKVFLNTLPSLASGLLVALLLVPLLPHNTAKVVTTLPLWQQAQKLQDLIIGVSALVCLFVLWAHRPKVKPAGEEGGKHHKG